MPGDVERETFRPGLRFANVGLQQGRLLLPSDLNEQSAIHHHFLRAFITDLVGRAWAARDGFTIATEASPHLKISIAAGHFYVDGIMCQNESLCTYDDQPFHPTPDEPEKLNEGDAVAYLDCWERHVSWLNFPELRDPALNGADTTTRIQIAWQVRVLPKNSAGDLVAAMTEALKARITALDPVADADARQAMQKTIVNLNTARDHFPQDCKTAVTVVDALDTARPFMAADAKQDVADPDPCTIAADLEYRGRENQLYRVEIHRPGLSGPAGPATFKWSRENGSVAFKVIDIDLDKKAGVSRLTLERLGRDRRTGLCEGDWVEPADDDSEFRWLALPLLQVSKVDVHRRMVTLTGPVGALNLARHPLLRRWDHVGDDQAEGALVVRESKDDTGWIDLERGIRIRFAPGGLYSKGDYWLIPARAATGDIEWPAVADVPQAVEPSGIKHHRAVLATLKKDPEDWAAKDCPCRRDPLCG
jgi:hypothetical protein